MGAKNSSTTTLTFPGLAHNEGVSPNAGILLLVIFSDSLIFIVPEDASSKYYMSSLSSIIKRNVLFLSCPNAQINPQIKFIP